MKKTEKYAFLALGICLVSFFTYSTFIVGKNQKHIGECIQPIFEESIKTYINKEKAKIPFSIHNFKYDPQKNGKYENKTFQLSDTVFNIRSEKIDLESCIYEGIQILLLENETFAVDTLNLIFDNLCQKHRIYGKSVIGVKANFHKTVNLISKDTTTMAITHRIEIPKQGESNKINYCAYFETTSYTHWRLFPKTALLIMSLLLVICIICIIYQNIQKSKVIIETTNKKPLLDKNDFTKQQQGIVDLFLSSPNHHIKKETIKETLWPHHINATTNMTTFITRIKPKLEKCGYTIKTSEEDDSYYKLIKIIPKTVNMCLPVQKSLKT